MATQDGVGEVDIASIQSEIKDKPSKRKNKYAKYTPEDRYSIGKYASENGPIAAVRKFNSKFANLNESTARTFRDKYEEQIAVAKKKGTVTEKSIISEKRGRPLLLGGIDEMVQKYLVSASNRGAVISRSVAVSCAKALIARYPDRIGNIDVESSHWAQSLFRRMKFVRRRATTSKLQIPDGAFKEAKLLYLNDIVSKVNRHKIPDSLIINIDQTPTKYVPVGRTTLAAKNAKTVAVAGSSDKRTITATFSITLNEKFLPMQLIYGGTTTKSLPRFQFPDGFCLSFNKTHYSNENEACKLIKEVLKPYIDKVIKEEKLSLDQKALVIMDVFTGQMTKEVLDLYKKENIEITCVPANMTHLLQPLDLTVNGYAKKHTRRKFNDWYTTQIGLQLDKGKSLQDITVPLLLTHLKPIHAQWMVDLYNDMTKESGKNVIKNAWKAAGITEALESGIEGLESLDPFQDIDPMLQDSNEDNQPNLSSLSNLSEEQLKVAYTPRSEMRVDESDEESEYEHISGDEADVHFSRNAFDAFD